MFSSESEFESTEFILGILVNNPLNFKVTEKPVVEQTRKHNFMCTMNRKKIPIGSEKQMKTVPTTRKEIRENFIFSMVLFAKRFIWKNIVSGGI